jgi:hypothetical protein
MSSSFFSPAYSYLKLFLAINAFRSLLVYYQLLALEKAMKPTTTEPLPLLCKLLHPGSELFVLVRLSLVSQRVPAHINEAGRTALTQPKAGYDIGRGLSPCLGR